MELASQSLAEKLWNVMSLPNTKPSALSLKLLSLYCISESYTLFISVVVLLYIIVVLLFIPCCGYFFHSLTHLLVLLVPLLFVCETSCLVTCPCFYVSPVFCLQPRKCSTCQVCLMFTFNPDTTLRQSHFNGNMDDKRRQNISLSNSS
jgi:hypothetical protein